MPSWNLSYWGRHRGRGGRVPIDTIVYKQTRGDAEVYPSARHGVLQPGMRADLNVIDYDRLTLRAPYLVYDVLENTRRFIRRRAATASRSAPASRWWRTTR